MILVIKNAFLFAIISCKFSQIVTDESYCKFLSMRVTVIINKYNTIQIVYECGGRSGWMFYPKFLTIIGLLLYMHTLVGHKKNYRGGPVYFFQNRMRQSLEKPKY